ncbi:MAG: TA system VapC family ribonuclease toxin [Candidatus Limnocylindria bacterium]
MSATIDANVLLYASNAQSPYRERAVELIDDVARGPQIIYLFWPTVMAYLRLATHPSVFARPMSLADARSNVSRLLELPNVQTGGESAHFWDRFGEVADDASPRGNLVPDAHLVALMLEHGVRTIWTHDRDYRRFRGIEVLDPFAAVGR